MGGLKYVIFGGTLLITATQLGSFAFGMIFGVMGFVLCLAGLSSKEK